MNLLVDTCIWSLALRRRKRDLNQQETAIVSGFHEAIERGNVRILGIVRQELLTGVKNHQQFENLREILSTFPDVEIGTEDHIEAAKLGNACRAKGVAAHAVDMLLCAVAIRQGSEILTTDPDFDRYEKIVGARLHKFKL